MPRKTLLAILLLIWSVSAGAYVRNVSTTGTPLVRGDAANIQFQVTQGFRAGATNSSGTVIVTNGSDPLTALTAATLTWSAVSGSTVRFLPLKTTLTEHIPTDQQNIISITDSLEDRSVVGSLLAITLWQFDRNGTLVDTDIIFNPGIVFSTDRSANTYDIQAVATHEIGHALGAGHSGLICATMFQNTSGFFSFATPAESTTWSTLSSDDKAFLIAAYPDSTAAAKYGKISGTARLDNGLPLPGALIIAVDPTAGVVVGGLSDLTDGTYSISAVPPGNYQVYAQPLNGPVMTSNLNTPNIQNANTTFLTSFAGGNSSPGTFSVAAGATRTVDISAGSVSSFHITNMGVGSANGTDYLFASVKALVAGTAADILIWGNGLDSSITQSQIRVLGPGVTMRPGTLRTQASSAVGGLVPLRVTVDVAARTSRAPVVVAVGNGSDMTASSGALVIVPPLPSFTAGGVVNGASGLAGVAPGAFVAIYGSDFTDVQTSWDSAIFDNKTLPVQLGGVRVRINGKQCYVNFVAPTQVNVLAPPDTLTGSVPVEVTNGSGTRTANVLMSQLLPGFFGYTLGGVFYPAALFANSFTYVAAAGALPGVTSRPATTGDLVVLYATGLGIPSPAPPTGQVLTTAYPIDAARVRVTFAGVPATVQFVGQTFAGVFQINIQIPGGIGKGNVPIVLTIDGVASQNNAFLTFQ